MITGRTIVEAQITEAANGLRLDRALADAVPNISRERIKALIASGNIRDHKGQIVSDGSSKATSGSAFTLDIPAPTAAHNVAQEIALNIAYEDEHLIVIDKPAGLVVHPAAGNADGTLVNALLHHCAGQLSGVGGVARPGIVHRIDKDTSGLMVAAKTDLAHEGLAKQFADHSIQRRYRAIVSGRPNPMSGTVDAPLGRSTSNRKKIAIANEGYGKRAVTHYKVITPLKDAALIECRLETGRTHQIRVHMTSIGHGLLGDPVYGRVKHVHNAIMKQLNFSRQALHAAHLGFIHPVDSNSLAFESEIPDDMQQLFRALSV